MVIADVKRTDAVFVWATGQDDNLGDSLLRRAYLARLREIGTLDVWIGSATPAFCSGLRLDKADRSHVSYFSWYLRALNAVVMRRTLVAVNAGEVPVSKRGAARMVSLLPLIMVAQFRGGGGVWLGAGVPLPEKLAFLSSAYKCVAKVCKQSSFRDIESLRVVGDASRMPDWAFALGTSVGGWVPVRQRRHLGLVMRGDRPYPDRTWLAWIKDTAVSLGLEIVIVVQVLRDTDMAMRLAKDLDGSVAEIEFKDHSTMEAAVRRVYANCALVVGDRLHGLIVAATEGAVPLGWVPSSSGKIARHFDTVGLGWVGRWEGHQPDNYGSIAHPELEELRSALEEEVARARTSLDGVATRLVELFVPPEVMSGE